MWLWHALLHLRPAFKHEQLWVKQLLLHEHFLKPSPPRMLWVLTISRKEILAGVHGQLLMSCFSRAARNGILSDFLHNAWYNDSCHPSPLVNQINPLGHVNLSLLQQLLPSFCFFWASFKMCYKVSSKIFRKVSCRFSHHFFLVAFVPKLSTISSVFIHNIQVSNHTSKSWNQLLEMINGLMIDYAMPWTKYTLKLNLR